MITTCPKCHQLYESLESQALHPERRCPRCAAVADLFQACEAAYERSLTRSEGRGKWSAADQAVHELLAAAITKARATL